MWRIYINYGTKAEHELTASQSFKTKKEAIKWALEHDYPQKCVVRENTYNEYKEKDLKDNNYFVITK